MQSKPTVHTHTSPCGCHNDHKNLMYIMVLYVIAAGILFPPIVSVLVGGLGHLTGLYPMSSAIKVLMPSLYALIIMIFSCMEIRARRHRQVRPSPVFIPN